MDCLFGLVGDGFALLVADSSAVQSIVVQKTDEDKIMVLDSHKLLGNTGETGDRSAPFQHRSPLQEVPPRWPVYRVRQAMMERLWRSWVLFIMRNVILGLEGLVRPRFMSWLLPEASVWCLFVVPGRYTKGLTDVQGYSIEPLSPYQTNLMLAGFDKDVGPSLYFLDYISTLHKIEKGAMGYGGFFVLSMMDKYYKKGMSLEDALALVDKCIEEIRSRLVVAPPNFIIKVVDKDGARFLGWRKSVGDSAATSTVNEGPAVAVETSMPVETAAFASAVLYIAASTGDSEMEIAW
eukprot:SM000028S10153  [mRNA]  locus=s28:589066:593681:- [translate_table: standard]